MGVYIYIRQNKQIYHQALYSSHNLTFGSIRCSLEGLPAKLFSPHARLRVEGLVGSLPCNDGWLVWLLLAVAAGDVFVFALPGLSNVIERTARLVGCGLREVGCM